MSEHPLQQNEVYYPASVAGFDRTLVVAQLVGLEPLRVFMGIHALQRELFARRFKPVPEAEAEALVGGRPVLDRWLAFGVLILAPLEHGNSVTTPACAKLHHANDRRRASGRAQRAESPQNKRATTLEPATTKRKKQRKKKEESDQGDDPLVDRGDDPPVHPVVALDQHQETDATRPQLTLAPSVIPGRSAFREAQEALCEEFASLRAGSYKWQGAKDGAALKGLLEAGATAQELRERWARALQLEKWPACATVAELASKWNHLARVEVKHKIGTSNVF